jgi:hypothetical protein
MHLRPIMQCLVSVSLMALAAYLMVWPHDADSQRWASDILSGLMGYWLGGKGR